MSFANETILYVDLNKLEENFNYLKAKLDPKTKIIGVVKAFAYGHGDVKVSEKLAKIGVYALWVSDFEEGLILRKSNIKTKIIVANPGIKSYSKIIKYKLDIIVFNHKTLDLYCAKKHPVNIHVKFNTGMNRYGFNISDIEEVVLKIKNNPHLNLISICSHLAESCNKNTLSYTKNQLEHFNTIFKKVEAGIGKVIQKHILNSQGVLNFSNYQLDAVRLGLGLYGSNKDKNLKQIGRLNSVVSQIRHLSAGDSVGYGREFIAKKDMSIAVIPVGYADGLNRRLGNSVGNVFINNFSCTIIGEVSMDSCMVDITGFSIKEGDIVEIFGDLLPVNEIAKKINTIPYEIYSSLNRRIKRVYYE